MMKVKLKLITLVFVVVMCLAFVLCACNNDTGLITQNKERTAKQVSASATFNGREAIVDVNELYASFYNYYSYLYSYYSYGYITADQFQSYLNDLDTTFADSNESLGRSALYTLKCIDVLYNHYKSSCTDTAKVATMEAASTTNKTYNFSDMSDLERYYKERIREISTILDCSGDYTFINQAIYYANNQMQSLFDDYVSTVESEYDALTPDEDETPKGYTDIELVSAPNRLVYEKEDSAINTAGMVVNAIYSEGEPVRIPNKYLTITGFSASSVTADQTITVSYGKYSKTFTVDIVEAYPSRLVDQTENDETKAKNEIAELTANNTKRLTIFSFDLDEADYISDGQTDEERELGLKNYKIARTAMGRVQKYLEDNFRTYYYYLYVGYNTQVKEAAEKFLQSEVVVTKEALTEKYDSLVAEELEAYASTPYSKDTIDKDNVETYVHTNYANDNPEIVNNGYFYVTQILFKFDDDAQGKIDDFAADKVANDNALIKYREQLAPEIVTWVSNTEFEPKDEVCEEEECTCARCPNYNGEPVVFDTLEKWYGLYDFSNDPDYNDPCVKYSHGIREVVCTCAVCPCKKYLYKEKASNAIAALTTELNSKTEIADKVEVFNKYILEYNMDDGVLGYIADKKPGYLMTPDGISSGMVDEFDAKCRALLSQGVGAIGQCTTEYGVHFIMISKIVTSPDNGTVTPIENDYVKLGLDYVTNAFAEPVDDEHPVYIDGNTPIEIKEGTVAYYIWQDLYADACNTKLAAFQRTFYDEYADTVKYFPNTYKSIVKDLQKNNESTESK